MMVRQLLICCLFLFLQGLPARATAGERYAVIIGGIGGEPEYAEQYRLWAGGMNDVLHEEHGFPQDHLFLLVADPSIDPTIPAEKSSLTSIERVFTALARQIAPEDLFFVILIGHGSATETGAKFNIPGPDMSASVLNGYLASIKATRMVVINGTSSSAPFISKISGPNRVIITATKSGRERLVTVFPKHFLAALSITNSDLDKDGQVSLLEAFTYTRLKTAEWYEDQGRLATEHPLLDDNGDRVGSREPGGKDGDGMLARVITFGARKSPVAEEAFSPGVRTQLTALERRSQDIQHQIDTLKLEKSKLSEDQYASRIEVLLIELARLNREIKTLKAKP